MESFDWKAEILLWTQKRREAKKYNQELLAFFTNTFNYNLRPEKALFGTNDYSISLLVGNIYFGALTKDSTIWLLLDMKIDNIPNAETHVARSAKTFDEPLYWLSTNDLSVLKEINSDTLLWQSYKRASNKIFENKSITAHKAKIAYGKVPLNSFWTSGTRVENSLTTNDLNIILEKQIRFYKTLSQKERIKKLNASNPKPEKIIVTQYAFKRNPLVVIEVLDRAKGICERCKMAAPFLKDKDSEPYLEVHHVIPLAEDGDDTIENAVALCANCHRHAHFAKSTY